MFMLLHIDSKQAVPLRIDSLMFGLFVRNRFVQLLRMDTVFIWACSTDPVQIRERLRKETISGDGLSEHKFL